MSRAREPPTRPRRAAPYYSGLVPRPDHRTQATARAAAAPPASGGVARNTAIFSIATALSRIAGLAREIVAASFFGTTAAGVGVHDRLPGPEPGRNLFANAALSAAFVPVFTDLLQQGRKREAFRLASTLFWIMLIALGAITAFFDPRGRHDHAAVHRPDLQRGARRAHRGPRRRCCSPSCCCSA